MARSSRPANHAHGNTFPSDTYAKYKRATSYFLTWLLRAHNGGNGNGNGNVGNGPNHSLDLYESTVATIATAPTALPPAVLQLYPHALDACESAITLRIRVVAFLAEAADDAHAHFLDRMKRWYEMLKTAYTPPVRQPSSIKRSKSKASDCPVDFSNYYDVLALPDDYFSEDVSDALAGATRPVVPTLSVADQKWLCDEAFAQDLNAELACLFMELEELSESVYAVFHDVKREKKTLLEATAVTKVAIDCAATVIAKLQLQYPMIQSAEDMCTVIQDRMSVTKLGRLVSRVEQAWEPSRDPTEIRYRYVPGTILVDLLWISKTLLAFAASTRGHPHTRLNVSALTNGLRYNEDETPHYTVPDWSDLSPFFMQQLPLLHNVLIDFERHGISLDTPFLETWFLEPFDRLRRTGTVSIHIVFICICWIRSIAALQGNGGLGRTVSLSMLYRWDLHERLGVLLAKGCNHHAGDHFVTGMQALQTKIDVFELRAILHRVNPILAGCTQLDLQIKFLELGNDTLMLAPFFRAFCHIYSALRTRRLIDEIPFVEAVIAVYEDGVFATSRAAVTHGSFARSYLVAKNIVEAGVISQCTRKASSEETKTTVDRVRLINISPAFRLLYVKDYSGLPSNLTTSSSWKALLSAVTNLWTADLFDSRVLSRDMLSLNSDLTGLFHKLCDELGRRPQFEKMLRASDPRVKRHLAEGLALENAVVFPLVPLLDIFSDDQITSHASKSSEAEGSGGSKIALCQRAAYLIRRHFEETKLEEKYFIFPPTPTWASTEFGIAAPVDTEYGQIDEDEFSALMDMLAESDGPLTGTQVAEFKRRVLARPRVIEMAFGSPYVEFNTLLHHAAAGPAHDRRLLEWLLQAGALTEESPHCRFPDAPEIRACSHDPTRFWNTLAAHCAAQKGLTNMVKIIMEAGNWRDLNTTTFRTKESLMHIAVKTNNRLLFNLLAAMDADVSGQDMWGNHVWELTKNRSWSQMIKQMAGWTAQGQEKMQRTKTRHIIDGTKKEKLRSALQTQQDAERRGALSKNGEGKLQWAKKGATGANVAASKPIPSQSAATTEVPVRRTKKKKKQKKRARPSYQHADEVCDSVPVTELMGQLFTSSSSELHGSRIPRLSSALAKLRDDVTLSPEECESSAKIVTEVIDELTAIVDSVVKIGLLTSIAAHAAEVREAAQAVFLLADFGSNKLIRSHLHVVNPEDHFGKLIRMLLPADNRHFKLFYELAIKAALLLVWCDEVSTTEKIVALVEGWLLEIRERSDSYRELVSHYIDTRRSAGLQPLLGSTPEVERQLQWYAKNHGVEDETVLAKLDRLHGCSHYIRLKVSGGLATPRFRSWVSLIEATRFGRDVICVGDWIIAGAHNHDEIIAIVKAMVETAGVTDTKFELLKSLMDVPVMPYAGFEFSTNGILPMDRRESSHIVLGQLIRSFTAVKQLDGLYG